jgi:DNA-directed RNA polymerase sigma subunit (sigma70/sigma32)
MARSLEFLSGEGWLSEDGWPYADGDADDDAGELEALADPAADLDDDLVALHASGSHVFDDLDPVEKAVLAARFGFDGEPRTMRQLQQELHLPRAQLRAVYGDALAKVRVRLT